MDMETTLPQFNEACRKLVILEGRVYSKENACWLGKSIRELSHIET